MGGSSSGPGTMNDTPAESANFDPEQVKAFANSAAGSKYSPSDIEALKGAHTWAGGTRYTAVAGTNAAMDAGSDITGMANDFNSWLAQQAASGAMHNKYADLANSQMGRDSTILTGPVVNPNTVLGQPAPAPGPFSVNKVNPDLFRGNR